MHRGEIDRLERKIRQKGLLLVPLGTYHSKGRVKSEHVLAKGNLVHDKRDAQRMAKAKRRERLFADARGVRADGRDGRVSGSLSPVTVWGRAACRASLRDLRDNQLLPLTKLRALLDLDEALPTRQPADKPQQVDLL